MKKIFLFNKLLCQKCRIALCSVELEICTTEPVIIINNNLHLKYLLDNQFMVQCSGCKDINFIRVEYQYVDYLQENDILKASYPIKTINIDPSFQIKIDALKLFFKELKKISILKRESGVIINNDKYDGKDYFDALFSSAKEIAIREQLKIIAGE